MPPFDAARCAVPDDYGFPLREILGEYPVRWSCKRTLLSKTEAVWDAMLPSMMNQAPRRQPRLEINSKTFDPSTLASRFICRRALYQ
jgi:hypothetical protein